MTGDYIPATPRRAMTDKRKAEAFLQCNGKCVRCGVRLVKGLYEVDHRVSLFLGGADELANLECLCIPCHRGVKTPADKKVQAKVSRIHKRLAGIKKPGPKIQSRGFVEWRDFSGNIVRKPG